MCGIAGTAGNNPSVDRRTLQRQCDLLCHRGPDDEGVWWSADGTVGLAHRRLSIVDLSSAGHQPMTDATGELQIVLNGEIYNFRELRTRLRALGHSFQSSSDTEVLLAAYRQWGNACLQYLEGMFAFALFDLRARKLLIARDRAGEKPLFYHHSGGRFSFASEVKALLLDPAVPRDMDPIALRHYLAFGYVPAPLCMLSALRKLPPGKALTYDVSSEKLCEWTYWSLPPAESLVVDDDDLVDELDHLLEQSVRQQLVADVPVGILLSGGIDSSLITAMAARVADQPVRTFTVTFPGMGRHDEGPYARQVASHFGTDHTELAAEQATLDLLPQLARQYDDPIADSSMIPTFVVSRLIRKHAKVALGGDGGDELFGGYPHHAWTQRLHEIGRRTPALVRSVVGFAARHSPQGTRGRNYAIAFAAPPGEAAGHLSVYFDAPARNRLLMRDENPILAPEKVRAALGSERNSVLGRATAMDFRSYLPDDILAKVDRASMLASLEVRAPFLHHRVIEFAFARVPDRLKATSSQRKILPRMLAARLLPPALDLERKQGFSLPLDDWLRGPWGDFMLQILRGAPPDFLNQSEISSLFRLQARGYSNSQRIFALAILELWRREYRAIPPR